MFIFPSKIWPIVVDIASISYFVFPNSLLLLDLDGQNRIFYAIISGILGAILPNSLVVTAKMACWLFFILSYAIFSTAIFLAVVAYHAYQVS